MTAIIPKSSWMDCLVTSWPPSSFVACHVSTAREAWLQMRLSDAAIRVCKLQPSRFVPATAIHSSGGPAWCLCRNDGVVVGVSCWICKAATLVTACASWIQLDGHLHRDPSTANSGAVGLKLFASRKQPRLLSPQICGCVIWSFVFQWAILRFMSIHMAYCCILNSVLWWYLTPLVGGRVAFFKESSYVDTLTFVKTNDDNARQSTLTYYASVWSCSKPINIICDSLESLSYSKLNQNHLWSHWDFKMRDFRTQILRCGTSGLTTSSIPK